MIRNICIRKLTYTDPESIQEEWTRGGVFYRPDSTLPARIFYRHGKLCRALWYQNGNRHREEGPAEIWLNLWSESPSTIRKAVYFHKGKMHRVDGPASLEFHFLGHYAYLHYYRYGRLHRAGDLPAAIVFGHSGTVQSVQYMQHGHTHRESGPAYIRYNGSGNPIDQRWYLNGKEVRPESE